jgi:hypothetical protein
MALKSNKNQKNNFIETIPKRCWIKLFLSLIFGFALLFAQDSFAYTDALKDGKVRNCASFANSVPDQWNVFGDEEKCVIDKTNIPNWNKYNEMGLSLDYVKIPYASDSGNDRPFPKVIYEIIKNVQFANSDYGVSNCNAGLENWKNLKIAKTYTDVKTAIIRSCLPGSIVTRTKNYTLTCIHDPGCHKCWAFGKCCDDDTTVYSNYSPNNYPSWSTPGCGKLIDTMNISFPGGIQTDASGRVSVDIGDAFTVAWNMTNPSASCTVTGKNPNIANSAEATIASITAGAGGSGQTTYDKPLKGIYTYKLECSGVTEGSRDPSRSVQSKTIKIYVGNIPADPDIQFNALKDADLTDFSGSTGVNYQIAINKSFRLNWNIKNSKSVKLWRQKTILDKKIILSTKITNNIASPLTVAFEGTDTGGFYTFWLEAEGELPEQKTNSQKIIIYAKEAGKINVPEGQFTADKTEIKRDEPVVLSWSIAGASEVNINQGVGKVQNDGSITVNPNLTTTYTLTAKNPIVGGTDTKKTVTIVVKNEGISTEPLITPFVPPESPEVIGVATSTKQAIDLKVNGTDGPVTLSAPAKFTLSWNLDTYCLATGSWLSIKTQAGNESVSLNKNGKYTYSLYCPGYGTDSIIVNVVNSSNDGLLGNNGLLSGLGNGGNAISMPTAEASVSTDGMNYSQDIKVIKGEATDIYIKISNDSKISRDASGAWSELMSNGGFCLYNTNLIKSAPLFNGMIESPISQEACNSKLGTYTFSDEPGTYQYGVFRMLQNDQKFSNISYVNITIENPAAPTSGPAIDLKINGNDAADQVLGTPANFNVSWNVANADTCEASGSWTGSRDMNGTQNFVSSSKKDFVYTLTCVGQLGTTVKSINLKVAEAPFCSFTALPPSINKTSSFVTESELSWKCDYSDECGLSPNTANATIKTYGSLRVSPDQTTTYVLTCNNSDASRSFEAEIKVE